MSMTVNAGAVIRSRLAGLSEREHRVALLLARGDLRNTDVRELLDLSPAAMSNATASMRRKLGVPRHADLAWFVAQHPELIESFASDDVARDRRASARAKRLVPSQSRHGRPRRTRPVR